ncbi:gata zinc finger domain-containing protein [Favolaschia claudopus]|uniref:Gata zinc finger domain-containing protein n=1 Tax=Favolaschia claudopus TaxID=2862362 RepID=A0AAW0D148_9AGAR
MYTYQQHPLLNSHLNEDREEEFKLKTAMMMYAASTASGSSSSSMMHMDGQWWNFANNSAYNNTTRSRSESTLYEHAPSVYYPTPAFPQGVEGVYPGPQSSLISSYSHLPYEFSFSDYPAQFLADNSQWQQIHIETKPRVYVEESPSPEIASSPFASWTLTQPPSLEFDSRNEMLISSALADVDPSKLLSSLSSTSYILPHGHPPPPPSPSLSSSSSSASSPQTPDHPSPPPPNPAPLPSLHPGPAKEKSCSHCNATTTPLWRRSPTTHLPLCNACGLYLQQRNKMRPAALIAVDQASASSSDSFAADDHEELQLDANGTPLPRCAHCRTHKTSVWRRGASGEKLCNACGVYRRLRGRERPLELRGRRIRPRCKHPKKEVQKTQ